MCSSQVANMYHPRLTPPSPPLQQWEEQVLGWYTVHRHPTMLCAWLSGPAALAMERTPLPQVIDRCYATLLRRLSGLCTLTTPVWGTRWAAGCSLLGLIILIMFNSFN